MITIYRTHGLRIVIFTDDHAPTHLHIFGDGHAKIDLTGDDGGPELIWAEDMKRSEVRHAMAVVIERQAEFLARWRKMHG